MFDVSICRFALAPTSPWCFRRRLILGCLLSVISLPAIRAQESSLFHQRPNYDQAGGQGRYVASPQGAHPPGMTPDSVPGRVVVPRRDFDPRDPYSAYSPASPGLAQASWMYMPPSPLRRFQKHDIITIRVDEMARMRAEGQVDNRKNSLYDALLRDWLRLTGGAIKPATQSDGDPRVNGQLNSLYRANSAVESREAVSFNIAAEIVDIRPNGNLVLEANKRIWVNDNVFETSLIGICRAEDIGPDNTLLSRDLLDAEIRKDERGRVADGYRRGWFQRWFEQFQPF